MDNLYKVIVRKADKDIEMAIILAVPTVGPLKHIAEFLCT